MSPAENQARTFLALLAQLRPHWRRDAALPARIQALLSREKKFGSRDRRLYRELIYTALRYLPWVESLLDSAPDEVVRRVAWLAADTPATKAFRSVFTQGEPPAGNKAELLPAWFAAHCPEIFSGAELDAQLRRAPLWLRLQTDDPAPVWAEFDAKGWPFRPARVLPGAIEVLAEADITKSDVWQRGLIEVQDLGSQLILETIGITAGSRWLDACAGAGGKTLQLARILGSKGRIDAHDIRPAALRELELRAERAGVRGSISVLHAPPSATYDGVLVDAPCSGTGTWRRAPHLKWVTTAAQVLRAAEQQRELLREGSARVKPGGRLIYATCSLSRRENEDVVGAFLDDHADFQPVEFAQTFGFTPRGNGLTILPGRHDTDGFFVASLQRR